jgi:hypothetical protein
MRLLPEFKKPVASVYAKEVRTRLDRLVVPIFTPDSRIQVGDFGSFEGGRFVAKGNVRDRGLEPAVEEAPAAAFDFASDGKVSLAPGITAEGIASATLAFSSARAVVVSFKPGRESRVRDADAFGDALVRLWLGNELRKDRAVVWSVRVADGGTVVVSEQGDNAVDVSADAALLSGGALTIPNLNVGVQFSNERKAMWKASEPDLPMTVWIRLLRLRDDQADDAFGFEPGSEQFERAVAASKPASVSVDELIADLDT